MRIGADVLALRFNLNRGWSGLTPYAGLVPAPGTTRILTGLSPGALPVRLPS